MPLSDIQSKGMNCLFLHIPRCARSIADYQPIRHLHYTKKTAGTYSSSEAHMTIRTVKEIHPLIYRTGPKSICYQLLNSLLTFRQMYPAPASPKSPGRTHVWS